MSKKRALLIGINYYNMPQYTLSGCIDDICNIRNILIDAYGYDISDIVMLRDDTNDMSRMPTYENMIRELNDIATSSVDEIWIQYSGHGTQMPDISNNSISDEVIVPIDYYTRDYIYDYDIYNIIKKIQCPALLIFDCCHSGSIGNLPWTFTIADPRNNETSNKNIITIHNNIINMPNPNIYLLSGCKDNETSADVFNRELAQGVGAFSNSLNECLRDSHHEIDIMTLYKNICANLLKNGYSQNPVMSSSTNIPKYVFSRSKSCSPPTLFSNSVTIPITKNSMQNRMNSIIKNIA
jgi:hypothetical protein